MSNNDEMMMTLTCHTF